MKTKTRPWTRITLSCETIFVETRRSTLDMTKREFSFRAIRDTVSGRELLWAIWAEVFPSEDRCHQWDEGELQTLRWFLGVYVHDTLIAQTNVTHTPHVESNSVAPLHIWNILFSDIIYIYAFQCFVSVYTLVTCTLDCNLSKVLMFVSRSLL